MMPLLGVPIIVTTKTFQHRKHRKKRVNKKWAKRYGFREIEIQDAEIIFADGKIFVTKKGFEKLKGMCADSQTARRVVKNAYTIH